MTLSEKRDLLAKIITNEKNIDENLLLTLKPLACTTNEFENCDESFFDRLHTTIYSNLDDKSLLKKFDYKSFNKLSKEHLQLLFQEVYNRQTKSNDCEPCYIVDIGPNFNSRSIALGSINPSSNRLCINENALECSIKAKEQSALTGYNYKNASYHYLGIISHETQHSIQYQQIYDLLTGQDMSDYDRNQASINIMSYTLRRMTSYSMNRDIRDVMCNTYSIYNNEHNANLVAIKTIKSMITNYGATETNTQVLNYFIKECLRITYETDISQHIKDRTRRMHQYVGDMLKLFKEYISDCPTKDLIVKNVENYITSEEGRSQYEIDLLSEMSMCHKMYDEIMNNEFSKLEEKHEIECI